MVRGEGDVHHVDGLEARLSVSDDLLGGSSDGEDARLRRVDDGGEVVDSEHAEVGDGEGSSLRNEKGQRTKDETRRKEGGQRLGIQRARERKKQGGKLEKMCGREMKTNLVLLRLQLSVSSLGSERLGLGRDGSESFSSSVLDDGGDQSSRGGDGDADIGVLVAALNQSKKTRSALDLHVERGRERERKTNVRIDSPIQAELASGTSARARAVALTTEGGRKRRNGETR